MRNTRIADALKGYAQLLYTKHRKTSAEIAIELGTDEKKIAKWVMEGGWESIKKSLSTSREANLKHLQVLLEDLLNKMDSNDGTTAKDAELAIKYSTAIKNLEADLSIAEIVEVAESFTTWLLSRNQDLAKVVAEQFTSFISYKING